MIGALPEGLRSFRVAPIFMAYVLASLAVAGVVALVTIDVIDLGMGHFGETSHRTHDVAFGLLFATVVVGLMAQLWRPEDNVAGMAMTLVPVGALLLAAAIAGDTDVVLVRNPLGRFAAPLLVVAALLHPGWRAFFRSISVSRVSWEMVALVGVVAVPLSASAVTALESQRSVTDMHAIMGHYGFMAALSFTVIGTGLLASLRPLGWRLPAWITGLLPVFLGITSLLFPDVSSSLALGWALGAITWGAVFIAVAERGSATAERRLG